MDTNIKSLVEELLADTLHAYNINNRAHDTTRRGCMYAMDDRRCAMGRIMTDEGLARVLAAGRNTSTNVEEIIAEFGTSVLQEKWRPIAESKTGIKLLGRIQSLHDEVDNWDEHGPSRAGTLHALSIVRGMYETKKVEEVEV